MLQHCLKLLDSFKERQTSKLLLSIRQQILAKIQGPYFSSEVRPYFANVNKIGEPFTNFSTEPKQIIQIKEIINGIYHAELAFRDLETVNLREAKNWFSDLQKLWFHTVKHGYHASYLLTHLGIDLTNIFADEIRVALRLLSDFNEFTDKHAKDATAFATKLKEYPISYNGGLLGGIAVDQMRAGSGKIDYHFLTQFGFALPGYIQQFTSYIQKFSPELASVKSTLDKKQLNSLQKEGLKLLRSLENLQDDNDLFLPAKIVYYVDILRHVIYLSQSTLEQAKNFDESSQEVIRNNLAELKYKGLIPLFHFLDRIEDEALLAPGTLSNPLMAQLKPLYNLLIKYTSNVVNFSVKGKELIAIEDNQFMELRLAPIRQRIIKAHQKLIQGEQALKAHHRFFALLKKYENKGLISLPASTKQLLEQDYKFLQPYLKQLNNDLNNKIISALTTNRHWRSFLPYSSSKIKASEILALEDELGTLLAKDGATQQFHLKLNENSIKSIYEQVELRPYESSTNHFSADEYPILANSNLQTRLQFAANPPNHLLINTDALNATQALLLYKYYAAKIDRLKIAQKAYTDFLEKLRLNHPNLLVDLDDGVKDELRRLYGLFRPYMIDIIKITPGLPNHDAEITAALSIEPANPQSPAAEPISTAYFFRNNALRGQRPLQHWFKDTVPLWKQRAKLFQTLAKKKSGQATREVDLTPDYLGYDLECMSSQEVKKNKLYVEPIGDSLLRYKVIDPEGELKKGQINRNELINLQVPNPITLKWLNKNEVKTAILGITSKRGHTHNLPSTERQNHLIKHKDYSKAIGEFKESLSNLTALFNKAIQKELKPDVPSSLSLVTQLPFIDESPPFSVLQDRNKTLQQGQQVIGLKRLYNCIYHLENSCHQLEKLNNKSFEGIYVYHLIQANNHVGEIVELSKALYEDPLLRLLASDLTSKAKHLWETLLSQSEPYRKDHETVAIPQTDKKLEYGSIWYSLNALMFVPTHIRSLLRQSEVSSEEEARITAQTKQVALNIESVIKSSNSYFKLFLKSPVMYKLFKELKQKLKQFTTVSHEAVMVHLEEINTSLFARILLETDEWEDRVGLMPGQLSGSMKTLLDEFYKGLVEPLGCVSQKHIALVTNNKPTIHRLEAVTQRKANAQGKKAAYMPDYLRLKHLMSCLKVYENFTTPGFDPPQSDAFIKLAEKQLLEAYQEVLPILQKELTLFSSPVGEIKASPQIDALLTPKTPEALLQPLESKKEVEQRLENSTTPTRRTDIKARCQLVYSYYKGLIKTWELREKTAEEKERYLKGLNDQQQLLKARVTFNYVRQVFKKQVDLALSRKTDLHLMQAEYNDKLRHHLLQCESTIRVCVETSSNIDEDVKKLVQDRVKNFDKHFYKKYAHLNEIMAELVQFESYIKKADIEVKKQTSLFESPTTLQRKKRIIGQLKNIASNPLLSTSDRIVEMRKIVTTPLEYDNECFTFKEIMLAHTKHHPFTYEGLKQLVCSFLTFFDILRPDYHAEYELLNEAILVPPDRQQLNRYRIFINDASPRYPLPQPIVADATSEGSPSTTPG